MDTGWALQTLALLTLAVLLASRHVPALQPYQQKVGLAVLVTYFLGGLGLLAWFAMG